MAMDKKNIVRWVLDILGAFVAVYVLWSVDQINDLVESDIRQGIEIEAMGETLTSMAENIARVADTLDKMVFEQEVSNRLDKQLVGDRWTAAMMEAHDNHWLEVLQKIHPDVRHSEIPDVREIQKRFGYGKD